MTIIFFICLFFFTLAYPIEKENYNISQKISIEIIKFYQKYLSNRGPRRTCKFTPSCSNYAITAIKEYNTLIGTLMTFDRLQRCHPFANGGEDLPESHYIFCNRRTNTHVPYYISNENSTLPQDSIFSFAEMLYNDGEYSSAIIEYKRFLNQVGIIKEQDKNLAKYKIGLCYYHLKDYDKALSVFDSILLSNNLQHDLIKKIKFKTAEIYYKKNLFSLARDTLYEILQSDEKLPLGPLIKTYIGFTYIEENNWDIAKNEFNELSILYPDTKWVEFGKELSNEVQMGKKITKKSPTLAAIISLIPGLGKIYAGKPNDGIVSALLTSTLGYLSYDSFRNNQNLIGGVAGILCISYYSGSIYGSIDAARNYNLNQIENFKNKLRAKFTSFYVEEKINY